MVFLLLAFYFTGAILLPLGDLSILPDLPNMYTQCKATEDKDLNVFEFITEHVSGIGQLVAGLEHDSGDDDDGDKPHTPVQFHFQVQIIDCRVVVVQLPCIKQYAQPAAALPMQSAAYVADYISKIFRPPIA